MIVILRKLHMPSHSFSRSLCAVATALALAALDAPALAADPQPGPVPTAAPTDAKPVATGKAKAGEAKAGERAKAAAKADVASPLAELAWLEGCWRGSVNEREFREHWLPLRGNLMIGVSHTVRGGKTQDYEYLRLEPRADGVYYVDQPSGQKEKETAFRLVERKLDTEAGRNDEIYTFAASRAEFPQRIVYRRASEGWLYAAVEGKSEGADKTITYPMRRIDCQSGEFIRK
ncbi:MAG: DUF6265 family protein [Betaproteobacteria bacterium]